MSCRWCGEPHPREAIFCSVCKRPRTLLGYLIVALDKAVIPLTFLFVAFVFSAIQRTSTEEAERTRWLADSYREFGRAYNAYRKSTVDLELVFEQADGKEKSENLRQAISKLDETFNYIGSSLMPFGTVESSSSSSDLTDIGSVWLNCFVIPYFGNREKSVDPAQANWARLMSAARKCTPTSCPESVRDEVLKLSDKIYSGYCVGNMSGEVTPLADFFDYTQEVVTKGKGSVVYNRPIPYKKAGHKDQHQ